MACEMPFFFIYDRTAALNEGDDGLEAIYFPSPLHEQQWTSASDRLSPIQCDVIRSIMGVVIKFEAEFSRSLPASFNLMDGNYTFMHIGKYTLALNRGIGYPQKNAMNELHLMYTAFTAFYGGFATANNHTTNYLNNQNVDREKAEKWCFIRDLVLMQPTDPAHSMEHTLNSLNTAASASSVLRQLAQRLSLIFESVSSCDNVLGSLSLYKSDILMSHNLDSYFIQLLKLLIHSDQMDGFGERLTFDVNNILAYRCFMEHGGVLSDHPQKGDSSFYVIIHIKGDLSLTLIIRSSPLHEILYKMWRRPCIRLKDELFKLDSSIIAQKPNNKITKMPSSVSADQLTLKESLSVPFLSLHSATLAPDAVTKGKWNPNRGSVVDSQLKKDLLLSSFRSASEAFCDGTDIAAVTMTHSSGYSVSASLNNNELILTGSMIKQTTD